MKVIDTIKKLQEWRESIPAEQSVGFVPTMGALHAGHESLLKLSQIDNDWSVLSIFVNPTQFNNPEDLKNYPNTFEQDLMMAEKNGVDVVFAPKDMVEMYPDQYRFKLTESEFSKELCGAHRPGHFDGVLTIVMKLFHLVQPKRAYFGEKDHQQLTLIRDMVSSFFMPLEIISCPTIREASGLAMSSRNLRLTAEEKAIAPKLYQTITQVKDLALASHALQELGFQVDYLVDRPYQVNGESKVRRYVAATLGKVRLIDNVKI